MKETALVIMAAGIGARYGAGIKQLAKVGPSGEIIIDYSIYDALRAGFDKIVFIIRRDIEGEFKEVIGNRIEKIAKVQYAYQDLNDLPEGFKAPAGRKKPWGTAQAIWAARDAIDCPFAVINADDFYGAGAFKSMHEFLVNDMNDNPEDFDYCMAGYILGNTLSDTGTVARGVCEKNLEGYLISVTETYRIGKSEDGTVKGEDEEGNVRVLDPDSLVSMNMWGLKSNIIKVLGDEFKVFLENIKEDDVKSEYLLPVVIDRLIKSGVASVKVLPVSDKWYGVTYHEDKQYVEAAVHHMVERGIYKKRLFG